MILHRAKLIVLIVSTLLLLCFGLLGTSLGFGLILARFAPNPNAIPGVVDQRPWIGFVLFFLGALLLYGALYIAWLKPRRKPRSGE